MSITENSKNIMKDLDKLKITNVDMGGYKIEPIISLMSLPTSPKQIGRPSKSHKLSTTPAKIIYDGTFVQSSTSLVNEIEEATILE